VKILIIQTAFIGDVVLATSFLKLVAQKFPEAQIDFLARKGTDIILENNPNVNQLHSTTTGILCALLNAKEKIGFWDNPLSSFYTRGVSHHLPSYTYENEMSHEVQRNEALLRALSYDKVHEVKSLKPQIFFNEEIINKMKNLISFERFIVMAPASVWKTKTWEQENWEQLIAKMKNQNIYLIGGPDDRKLCEELKGDLSHVISFAGELSLIESCYLISKADYIVAQDSGALHLASSVNTPVRAIFCSTIPDFGFFPLSDDTKIIEAEENLTCRPCGLHGKKACPKEHFKCSRSITVDQVLNSTQG